MYINQLDQLQSFCQDISQSKVIAVDTEFKRETTYYPELCLIQIANDQQYAIIDAMAIDDLSPINALFQNNEITKVLHSGSQDLEIFFQEFNELPKNIFDTQIAASVTGLRPQISFKDLIQHYLNIALDKSETRSDWTKRPLTDQQLVYAKYDVTYLIECYPKMIKDLQQLNRLHWLSGDFLALESTARFTIDSSTLWKKVRGHQNLNKAHLEQLNQLANWREHIAMDKNVPRKRAIKDEYLFKAAQVDSNSIRSLSYLTNLLGNQNYADKLEQITASKPFCEIKSYHALKLNKIEIKLYESCHVLIEQQSKRLNIDLKDYVSNSKIKALIKDRGNVSETDIKSWKDYAILSAIELAIK